MLTSQLDRGWRYPVMVWLIVLAAVFCTEYLVMLALPVLFAEKRSALLEAALDAVALTFVLAPVLWLTVVRPIREVLRLRDQFLASLFAHIEADRRATAHDLHDGVGQSLSLLVSGLRSAKELIPARAEYSNRLADLHEIAQTALTDVKRLALGLRPSLLDDLGLAPALERLASDIRDHHSISTFIDVSAFVDVRLPTAVETAVFRIAQQALANVLEHSGAHRVEVEVRREKQDVVLIVADDGCGIDNSLTPKPGHLGLSGMRERAVVLGGKLTIESNGSGTRIVASIPVGD